MSSRNAPSVADLAAQANNYTYNAHIPLANWLRTANTMQKEAQVYEIEGNEAQTYLLLCRHAGLVLDHLIEHPDRKKPENRKALNAATKTVQSDLQRMEELRPRIERRHEEYEDRKRRQQDALKALQGKHAKSLPHESDALSIQDRTSRRISYGERPALDARNLDNHSLAARLAQREVRRRDTQRMSVRQAGVSEEEEQERRTGGIWGTWDDEYARQVRPGDDLSSQIQEVARLQRDGQRMSYSQRPPSQTSTSVYNYPSVPHTSAQDQWSDSSTQGSSLPARPPKEQIWRSSGAPSIPPPLPPKSSTPTHPSLYDRPYPPPVPGKYASDAPPIPGKYTTERPPTPSNELDDFTFQPSAFLENGDPLRPVFLPSQLRSQFLGSASTNTRLNLETCGMLCGILKNNALFITRLIIPEQTSTSDTCETLNEEELFDYCDKENLLVVGWIHTHPTQTCFMSSRDLHTHVGYQVMMAESIAIVCAPSKQPSWGCFRLTDPPGKQAILSCSKPGIFHPHDVDNIYTEALKPGHVVELQNAPLEIVDLRPKKSFT
ncbi:STAM binding protein [Didymella exigua CBS 183.55]|uniref:STAM binding protein n=1 Tax=Didymella exigua CBS 183.55 TaxID=1150837 RepID=A0A6A5R8H8_9PLEO|nr:STAM binding protein [Didymella exigua CBS 183.55]KAF1923619.1 STAM binding protein [Didymella exigua CBS 183.55]